MYRPEGGGRLEVAISRVVREMLDVAPPAGLRGRVLQRIEGADSRSGVASAFRRKILWTAVPLATAAILVLALLLPSRTMHQQQGATTTARVEPRAVVETPDRSARSTPPVSQIPGDARRAPDVVRSATRRVAERSTERTVAAASFAPIENSATEIEPLQAITLIGVAPIAAHSTAPAAIAVRPLVQITEVHIAPLTPPDGRK